MKPNGPPEWPIYSMGGCAILVGWRLEWRAVTADDTKERAIFSDTGPKIDHLRSEEAPVATQVPYDETLLCFQVLFWLNAQSRRASRLTAVDLPDLDKRLLIQSRDPNPTTSQSKMP
jgi:hypothetical protein